MRIARLFLVFFVLTGCASGENQMLGPKDGFNLPPISLERVKVGMTAPDFTLESKDAERVTLSQFRGKKNVVMVFYRGYW